MHTSRASQAGVLLADGRVLVGGGFDNNYHVTNTVELFDCQDVVTPLPTILTNATLASDHSLQFGFTNAPGATFVVLASTNPAVPSSNWTRLGQAVEVIAGQFQFNDPQATNCPQRFYRVSSP